jgi:hypothetical protein
VALERLGAIFVPLRAKVIFTKKCAAIQLGIIAMVILVINGHFFWTRTLIYGRCSNSNATPGYFLIHIWPWLDFTIASFAPFVIMLMLNIAIIARMIFMHHMRKKNLNHSGDTKMTSMTGILITISFVFFFTTAPITIYLATTARWYSDAVTLRDFEKLQVAWASVNMAAYINYAVNFILYCLSGPRFRNEFLRMLHIDRWLKKVHPTETSTTIATIQTNTPV